MEQFTDASCAACGYYRTGPRVAMVGGASRRFCRVCAAVGKSLAQSGVLPLVQHCLHLVGCEIEHEAENLDLAPLVLRERFVARLARRLSDGALRAACECDRCEGRVSADVVIGTDLHERFGVQVEFTADDMPLNLLRSMPDSWRLKASDGTEWRAVDEIARRVAANAAGTVRGPVGPLAASAVPKVPPIRSEAQRKTEDRAARRFWRCWALFGEGYFLGRHFVDLDGVCHEVPTDD